MTARPFAGSGVVGNRVDWFSGNNLNSPVSSAEEFRL